MSLLPSTSLQTHIHFNQSLKRLSKRGRGGYWISGGPFPTVSLSTFLGWCSAIFSWLVVFYFRPVRMVCEKGTIKYHTWISYLRLKREKKNDKNKYLSKSSISDEIFILKYIQHTVICTKYAPFFPQRVANTGLRILHFLFLVVDFCIKLYPTTIVSQKQWLDSCESRLKSRLPWISSLEFVLSALNHRHIFQVLFLVGGGTQLKILKLGYPPSVYFKSKITLYP